MLVEHEPSDLHPRVERLHHRHHIDLSQRSVYWHRRLGIVLHERVFDRHDMPVEQQPSDLCARGQRLHSRDDLDLLDRAGVRALCSFGLPRSKLGRVADTQ
jgi:hypothetical protein